MNSAEIARIEPLTIRADSIGQQAKYRLSFTRSVAVHSSYRGAINLITDGGLVSLLPVSAGRGPINVNVDPEIFRSLSSLAARHQISIRQGTLEFADGLVLEYDTSRVYNPPLRFDRSVTSMSQVERNLEVSRETSLVSGKFGGLGGLLFESWGCAVKARSIPADFRTVIAVVRELLAAVRDCNMNGIRTSTRGLAGLGPGLTPSGDDLLAGFMLAYILGSENRQGNGNARLVNSLILRASARRTSTFSFEVLRQAAFGRANEKLRDLAEAIYTGEERDVKVKTLHVLSMGANSGTDLVVGVLLGVRTSLGSHDPC